jgi:Uri superfamily endonuclease
LVLYLPQDSALALGKLGLLPLPAGCYAYAGSALGAGGLRGRLSHHLQPVQRPRWHVDYLRRAATVRTVWWMEGAVRREHDWAALLQQLPGAALPVPRFGASDCTCASHLFHYVEHPPLSLFQRLVARRFPGETVHALAI